MKTWYIAVIAGLSMIVVALLVTSFDRYLADHEATAIEKACSKKKSEWRV